ncbi:FCD domain-containing protein [Actinomadura sp. B10D3]|uniref:FadR/GntR family transcriptional regulator n=1 Tax=Actinomadura sp. B10D3 TaxID=3153557 RepID=UPI00325DE7CD
MAVPPDAPEPGGSATTERLRAPALSGIRRLSALETVRARIALAVDLGLLAPGERLPANDQIARALDVAEITVRRALVSLCEDGLLERRRGRNGGTLVAEHPSRQAVKAMNAYRSAAADVHRLIDHRLALECGIAYLASRHADDAAVAALDDLVADMDRAANWAEFHGCDERFHLAVAAATGAPAAVEPYGAVLRDLYHYYLPYPLETLRRSNDEHRALVEAIRRHDAAAVDIAHDHVVQLHQTMFVGLTRDD